ncbi:hypothetical protein VTO73DRAFT_9627 [Trametes versicolor]
MPTGLTSKIYLAGVPPGLTFEITSIKPVAPNDGYDWKASFRRGAGEADVSCIGQTVYDDWPMPFKVSPSDRDGLIGEAHFEGHNGLWSSGPGAMVTIDFRLYGTTTVNGVSVDVNEDGVIPISTTDWGGFTRPDYVNVTYSWRRRTADPVNVALSVPATLVGMPDDLYFVPGVSTQEEKVGLATTTDRAIALTAVDYALKGIFWIHEKLFSWALGLLF